MTLHINERRLRYVTRGRTGPVGRFLSRTGFRWESTAKQLATDAKLVRSGRYRSSLAHQVVTEPSGLVLQVGSALPYARVLEHGSDPHIISPRGQKKALWWDMPNDRGWMVQPDDGRPVPFVNHPGGRAYGIVRKALLAVLLRP